MYLDRDRKRLYVRLVYAGPALSGKTETLYRLAPDLMGESSEGLVESPQQARGRTLYFDWAHYQGGAFRGYGIDCQIVTVPGQETLNARRRALISDADVVIFVADSSPGQQASNRVSRDEMQPWLTRSDVTDAPVVYQINKRDLADALPLEEIIELLGLDDQDHVLPSSAVTGEGLRVAFVTAMRAAVRRAAQLLEKGTLREGRPPIDSADGLLVSLRDGEDQANEQLVDAEDPATEELVDTSLLHDVPDQDSASGPPQREWDMEEDSEPTDIEIESSPEPDWLPIQDFVARYAEDAQAEESSPTQPETDQPGEADRQAAGIELAEMVTAESEAAELIDADPQPSDVEPSESDSVSDDDPELWGLASEEPAETLMPDDPWAEEPGNDDCEATDLGAGRESEPEPPVADEAERSEQLAVDPDPPPQTDISALLAAARRAIESENAQSDLNADAEPWVAQTVIAADQDDQEDDRAAAIDWDAHEGLTVDSKASVEDEQPADEDWREIGDAEIDEAEIDEAEVDEIEIDEAEIDEAEIDEAEIDETEIDETEIDETEIDETEIDETEIDETEIDETEIDETEIDETEVDETEVDEIEVDEIEVDEVEVDETEVDEIEVDELEVDELEVDEAEVDEAEIDEAEVDEPEVDEAEVDEPEVDEPEIVEIEVDEIEVDEIEVDEIEVDEIEVDEPEVDEPEVDEPEIDEAEIDEIEIDETEIDEIEVNEIEVDETEVDEAEIDEIEIDETEVDEAEIDEAEIDSAATGQIEIAEAELGGDGFDGAAPPAEYSATEVTAEGDDTISEADSSEGDGSAPQLALVDDDDDDGIRYAESGTSEPPVLPDDDSATLEAWPEGVWEVACSARDAQLDAPRARNGDWVGRLGRRWFARTSGHGSGRDDARSLFEQLKTLANEVSAVISRERCLVLRQDPDGHYRVWQVVRRIKTINQFVLTALSGKFDARETARWLVDASAVYVSARRRFGELLPVTLSSLGRENKHTVYTEFLPRDPSANPSHPPLVSLERELRSLMTAERMRDVDAAEVVRELEKLVGRHPSRRDLVELLQTILIGH